MNHYSLKLNQCLTVLPEIRSISGNKPDITYEDITFDSRKVTPGSIYVALKGINTDGHNFIPNAIQNGAVAVIGSNDMPTELPVPYIRVENPRLAMAYAAAALYRFPSNEMAVIGVTGTDGKTTTATLMYHILRKAGLKAGLISTVSAIINDREIDTGFHVTTPESPDIQRYLAQMRDEGITHVVCEVTSHGLSQNRVAAIDFDIAIVTNITHEHLDYHKTKEEYFAAKGMLFKALGQHPRKLAPLAVLNYDDQASYTYLSDIIPNTHKICYSASGEEFVSQVSLKKVVTFSKGLKAEVLFRNLPDQTEDRIVSVRSNLIGTYNCANILAAMTAAVYGLGISPEKAAEGVQEVSAISGRMEVIDCGQNFTAMVDFAHTPNALAVALDSARAMLPISEDSGIPPNRIIAVYGSAGLRDREKRRMMPAVSVEKADITILTAEDPRTESLDIILKEMADEALKHGAVMGENLFIEPDRGNAIRLGLSLAKPGDIVISFGKGHEQSMCFGTVEYAWDDRTAMRAALCEMLNKEGPQMPFLPTSNRETQIQK
ncbi:MAG TPA: UDP-N-acetylmuramoyl-L-alanyl-D-glutamate--2,6-diaminopimelate ligase [Flexilinea sp.]|nr:UDP-N-acetylmuramoyl-L-alanyl-D-glutamate--2,6-diaminopimelate ligase [Flexilinea sp.]